MIDDCRQERYCQCRSKAVQVNGLLVKPGVMVMNSIDECSIPQFSLAKEIFVDCLQRILYTR